MKSESNYKLAVALLRFKTAYHDLVLASKALPDLDVSDGYPFYLLDFEDIAPAVEQWCLIQADKLMKQLPDMVDNPACASCYYFRAGLEPSGMCKGFANKKCNNHPSLPFSRNIATPLLLAQGVNTTNLSDEQVQLLYMQKMDEAYEKQRS